MRLRQILPSIILTLVGIQSVPAKNLLLLTPTSSHQIDCVNRDGSYFIPARSVATALEGETANYSRTNVRISSFLYEFKAGNHFLRITDSAGRITLYHMPSAPIQSGNDALLPVLQFFDIVVLTNPDNIRFDRENFTVRIFLPELKNQPRKLSDIISISVKEKSNGTQIDIQYRDKIPVNSSAIMTDFHNVHIRGDFIMFDTSAIEYESDDAKDDVRVDSLMPNAIVFTIHNTISSVSDLKNGNVQSILVRTSQRLVSIVPQGKHDKWKMDVVVLDAGHGGQDPGAQGVTGINEKDVTLGIVLKLGRLLEDGGFKVVYTRKSDVFIPLSNRGEIANEAEGKLFLSIHCNSMPVKPNPAHGLESYILRPGKTESAVRVAARENNSVRFESNGSRDKNMTQENFIVASMAQSSFVRWSERFASLVQREATEREPALKDNGVNQAGFIVLIGASMPNILIETGYLSNPNDERLLASAAGQRKIAEGIFSAIKIYKKEYEKALIQ